MPIDVLPPLARSSPTFKADCDAFFGVKLPAFSAQTEAARLQIVAAESASAASAVAALSSQTAAQNAAAAAAGAANFRGNWADLAGALNRPACVKHAGRFWLLVSDLADVTTATPGVSASWTPMDVGTVPTQLINAGGTVAGVVGVRYVIAASSVELTAPAAGLIKGDYHGVRVMSGITGFVWDFAGTRVRNLTPGALPWDMGTTPVDLFYEDATRGYI